MTFRVVTHRTWLCRLFAPKGGVQDFGLDIDASTAGQDIWWAPGEWAARASRSGVALPLLSCGQEWLCGLPFDWLRRRVAVTPAHLVCEMFGEWDVTRLHVKLPEVKSDEFPARVMGLCEASGWTERLPRAQLVQVSDTVPMSVEARFFVARGTVRAESLYRAEGLWWSDDEFGSARERFADEVRRMRSLAESVAASASAPPGYVLDVGVGPSGDPVLIEANAAWSSNPYDADIDGVYESVMASQDPSVLHRRWLFDADQFPHEVRALPVRRVL